MMSVELAQSYLLDSNDKHLRIQVLLEHTKDLSWYQSKVEVIKALYHQIVQTPAMTPLAQRDFQQQFKAVRPRE
jgi:hypothetical protein